jgi:hypothetical protein
LTLFLLWEFESETGIEEILGIFFTFGENEMIWKNDD